MKRCARLFGVGRYLLDCPRNVVNEGTLANWLKSFAPSQPPTPANVTRMPQSQPADDGQHWTSDIETVTRFYTRAREQHGIDQHTILTYLDTVPLASLNDNQLSAREAWDRVIELAKTHGNQKPANTADLKAHRQHPAVHAEMRNELVTITRVNCDPNPGRTRWGYGYPSDNLKISLWREDMNLFKRIGVDTSRWLEAGYQYEDALHLAHGIDVITQNNNQHRIAIDATEDYHNAARIG